MKRKVIVLLGWILLFWFNLAAQEFTAAGYYNLENDPAYTSLKQRQSDGDTLTLQEQSFLSDFKARLDAYFEKLPDDEKSVYYKYRSKWAEKPLTSGKSEIHQDQEVFAGDKSAYTRYLVSSGVFGFIYGITAAAIIEPEEESITTGLALLSAGTATLIPILSLEEKSVTYNSLKLSIHGKAMGYAHGAALGMLIQGDNIDEGKLLLTLAGVSSISLGRLGYSLGRDKPWSQGRVALYSHYGILAPLEGLALVAAFESEDPRIYGASILAFGATGYLMADKVADWNDFTKGDIISTQTLTLLNAMLGFGIVADKNYEEGEFSGSDLLFPALGALGGSVAGHFVTKDTRFTKQQGRNTALAATGGSVVGLGMAALVSPERPTLYYVIPYITGLTTYSLLVNNYRRSNASSVPGYSETSRWNINLTPYNIFLNKKIAASILANPGKKTYMLPAFSASYSF